jgi:hypothetical protein
VARMPAPEMTAVDFQSMLERITAILTFRLFHLVYVGRVPPSICIHARRTRRDRGPSAEHLPNRML